MNLDDFIVPSSIGTPAGVSPAPSNLADETPSSTAATASAIPIKQQQRIQAEELQLSRASAPSIAPLEHSRSDREFGYVKRHVRKTSIDERRVCVRHQLHESMLTIVATQKASRGVATSPIRE